MKKLLFSLLFAGSIALTAVGTETTFNIAFK